MSTKQNPIRATSSPSPSRNVNAGISHIRIGSYYEIDHSILPQSSPDQLKSIRLVMVSRIRGSDVTLRYPSEYSLKSHFNNRNKPEKKKTRTGRDGLLPVMDESYVMTSEVAGDLLYRRIVPHELSTNRNSWSFWVCSNFNPVREIVSNNLKPVKEMVSKPALGKCWSELRSRGMIKWGKRLRVEYQKNNEEAKVLKEEDDGTSRKRKLIEYKTGQADEKKKDKNNNKIVVYQRKSPKKFIERWCVERYKQAEKNMLKVMKEKNAVFGNPILRVELRTEARKMIGDTGLLDHLLKHMAGKVAPGGLDRFRRKHNADGVMEYWLESVDLDYIRKEAGVNDPYWTPPPGWKLGDNPTQDPVCAGGIREIREGLASLKREMEKLTSKKEEEELLVLTTPVSCVSTQSDNVMTPAKEIYADLLKKKYKVEDQLVIIGETLRQMEEDMGWLQKSVNENCPRKADSTEMPLLLEDTPKVRTVGEVNKENQIRESPRKGKKDDRADQRSPLSLISKTGLSVSRPVASFPWTKMPALDDPTAFLSSTHAEFGSLPSDRPSPSSTPCPVKPVAAKRPLGFPFSFAGAPTNLFNL